MSVTNSVQQVTIAQGASVSGTILTDSWHMGSIQVTAGLDGSTINYLGASASGGTFSTIYPSGSTAAASTSVANSGTSGMDLPASVFNYPAVQLKMSGTQTALRSVNVYLKSY